MAAIATQLEQRLTPHIDVLQVTRTANRNPTYPCVDLYPGEPFLEPDTYGITHQRAMLIVRARVNDLDADAGQTLLLEMMDPSSPKSVAAALAADGSFGGACQDSVVAGPFRWGDYTDASGSGGDVVGCQWQLTITL